MHVGGAREHVIGDTGSLRFDFEDMNVLHVHDHTADAETAGFTRVLVTEPVHPYVSAWWPAGHLLGYEHSFTHQAVDLLTAIAEERDRASSSTAAVQRVLAAVGKRRQDSVWTETGA
jgi:hypothetical protein